MAILLRRLGLVLLLVCPASMLAQDDTREVLKRIVDQIYSRTYFEFVDTATCRTLTAVPPGNVKGSVRLRNEYNDWTYYTGVVLSGMLRVAEATGDTACREYVLRNFRFMFDNFDYFRDQWEVLQVPRAPFYRVFRMNMLDDCGSMGAALAEAYRYDPQPRFLRMLRKIDNYIHRVQLELPDGTLARPDPRFMTLWADDLYMSVPFLARMAGVREGIGSTSRVFPQVGRYNTVQQGEGTIMQGADSLTGFQQIDFAARQVTGFMSRLTDPATGLLKHAWFSDTQARSVASWGRANGWAVMAQVELLKALPRNHPMRDSLLGMFRRHMHALCRYQDSTGLWHQVLDQPDSYLETSCSAMFCYGLASAVNRGWLDPSYATFAKRAWRGVCSRVRPDGQIEGICRGTGVGFDLQFYYDRPTPLNDMRGIGAVLLAGSELVTRLPWHP